MRYYKPTAETDFLLTNCQKIFDSTIAGNFTYIKKHKLPMFLLANKYITRYYNERKKQNIIMGNKNDSIAILNSLPIVFNGSPIK
jgi:hypothetical protein